MIIDRRGHFTTAPAALRAWRSRQLESTNDLANSPAKSDLAISGDIGSRAETTPFFHASPPAYASPCALRSRGVTVKSA